LIKRRVRDSELARLRIGEPERLAYGPTSEISIALGPPLAGIPLDHKVLSLDIAQSAQLFEERLVEAAP
jgi:hypothetical protein